MVESKFWMVWNLNGYIPKRKHLTEDSALAEAKRLSQENPGQEFYVVEAISKCIMPDPVNVIRLQDLPF